MVKDYAAGPLQVMAIQVEDSTIPEILLFCQSMEVEEIDAVDPDKKYKAVNVATQQGVRRASKGDYVVKALHSGNVVVVKSHEFLEHFRAI
jgi:uncharacterized NAD-dependent epimerase/dehydratase family protein